MLYLGLSITTLHLEFDFLVNNHFEFLIFSWTLLATFFYFIQNKIEIRVFLKKSAVPFFLVLLLILAPAVSSFFSDDYLNILKDGEYKTLVKILCLCPFLFYFLNKERLKNCILNSVVFFYTVFAFYFLYRFFVLHEAREFDLRPTLHIRHGDPNFLCLFFSVMAPMCFSIAKDFFAGRKYLRFLIATFSGLLLIYCALVTESRMGLISLFTGLGLLFIISKLQTVVKAFAIGAASALVVFTMSQETALSNRFSDIKDKSSTDRILTYENGIKAYISAPVFGVGMHAAQKTYFENSKYPDFQSDSKRLEIHSTYLNVLAELGSFGFFIFFALLFWCFHLIIKSTNKNKIFILSSFVILFLSMLTIGVAYKDLIYVHIFMLAGLSQNQELDVF